MDQLSTIIKSFIDILCKKKDRVPHQEVQPFLSKLLDMAKIFKDECASEEERLLPDLLSNLLKQESKLSGAGGLDLLVSLLKVIDLLFQRLMQQVTLIRKLRDENERFLAKIEELRLILDDICASENISTQIISDGPGLKEMETEVGDFASICSSSNYIAHYVSHHRDFSSLVVVVLWKSVVPGPVICHEGLPVLYVHHANSTEGAFDAWSNLRQSDSLPPQREYTSSELQDAVRVKQVISQYQKHLFIHHSNLVAIRSSDLVNGIFFIEFVVLCKRFIPVIDKEPLPRHLEGIPTRVCSGWIELCGRKEQIIHRPLLPGAGFAAGEDAKLQLDVPATDYVPPVLGTLGGYYFANGVCYGVTCAHCIKQFGEQSLHSQGSPVFQPSAMGLILTAASVIPELLDAYDTLKNKGYQGAMRWLIEELKDNMHFTAELPEGARCGTVHGGVLGALENDGPVVDVALIRLEVDVATHCAPSLKFPDLKSPSLTLDKTGDTATQILSLENFPRRTFSVYGRGARSIDTMHAHVNPLQNSIYFRTVQPNGLGNLVFECIHADTEKNWQLGDSGTWCWTEDGLLLGMGMAYAHIEGQHYCCIMHMSNVLAAIEQLMK